MNFVQIVFFQKNTFESFLDFISRCVFIFSYVYLGILVTARSRLGFR